MIRAIVFDFSRVLLFPKDRSYTSSLNKRHRELSKRADYKLLEYFSLNEELLDYLDKIKERYELYVFTSETIQDSPELTPRLQATFKEVISALRLGVTKKEPDAYKRITDIVGKKPEEILFVDDSPENLGAAKSSGLQVMHYIDNDRAIKDPETRLA